jgi:hypothetical protein
MRYLIVSFLVIASACGSKKDKEGGGGGGGGGSGSSAASTPDAAEKPAGSGSATADTGSGSGGDTGSAAGSGSEIAVGSGSGAGSGEKPFVFADLSFEEKEEFMKKKVMPVMKKHFQEFDPKEFKDFTCKTCHGKDPKKAKFKMPSPDVEKLDFAKLKEGKQHPKTAEWMGKVVKPEMAKLLNMPEYDDKTPKGFGCLHCHEQVK